MFDEPSSYLDVKQRLQAARIIRSVIAGDENQGKYVLVVEHDLAVLDYLSGSIFYYFFLFFFIFLFKF